MMLTEHMRAGEGDEVLEGSHKSVIDDLNFSPVSGLLLMTRDESRRSRPRSNLDYYIDSPPRCWRMYNSMK